MRITQEPVCINTNTWVYNTGQAITLPSTKYSILVDNFYSGLSSGYISNEIHVYEKRNGFRMPSYHRLDVAINYKKEKKKEESIWNFSVYNLYNRQNPYFLFFQTTNKNYIN